MSVKTRNAKLLLTVLLLTCLGVLTLRHDTLAQPPQQSPPGNRHYMGINVDPYVRLDDFVADDLENLGTGWVRLEFKWTDGGISISDYQAVINRLKSRGISILGLVDKTTYPSTQSEWSTTTFRDNFVRTVVEQVVQNFENDIDYWEIWNEEDIGSFLNPGPTRMEPSDYAKLLGGDASADPGSQPWARQGMYDAIKAEDPGAKVLFGGLSNSWGDEGSAAEYLSSVYDNLDSAPYPFDLAAVHPYHGPDTDPNRYLHDGDNYPSILNNIRAVMNAKGDGGKPIWVTEIGWNTNTTYWPCVPPSVTLQQQAQYLDDGLTILLIEDTTPKAYWYQYQDIGMEVEECTVAMAQAAGSHGRYRPDLSNPVPVGSSPANPNNVVIDWWYGLVHGDYAHKPSYDAYIDFRRHDVFLPAVLKNYWSLQQLLQNGGFETGPPHDPWVEIQDGYELIGSYKPHSGQYGVLFGGYDNLEEEIYQTVTLPQGTNSLKLVFHLLVETDEPTSGAYDFLYVDLKDSSGQSLVGGPLVTIANDEPDPGLWARWTVSLYNTGYLAGQQVRVSFESRTDYSNPTWSYLDDVAFTVYTGSGAEGGGETVVKEAETPAAEERRELVPIFDSPLPTLFDSPVPTKPPYVPTIGEVGQLNDTLTHTPQTVLLSRRYADPVVFAQPLSRDGGDTSVIRISDVQSDRFTLYVDEAPNKDGGHTTEAVSYLVLEAGSWELADGTLLEVGKLTTSATVGGSITNVWEQVSFSSPFSAAPVVISQVQTENDAHWVKTRQRSVTTTGFDVAMEEEEAKTTPHGSEVIGWLAIEAGQGTWNGHVYEATQTANVVTHNWYQISFGQSFGQAPRFVAALATYDGGDSAHLRYSRTSLTTGGVKVMIEEDTTWDSETSHTTEVVGYLALEGDGTLTGWER